MSKGISRADRGEWERRWGRVRPDAKGRPVYVIRKQVGGHRYEVSTKKHTLSAALAEAEKFDRDPEAYLPGGDPSALPLYLDNDLAVRFLAYSKGEQGNSLEWVQRKKILMAWWMGKLKGVNLRRASLQHDILPPLEGAPDRPKRIEVIKAFYGWLRKDVHLVKPAADPTFGGVLRVPPPRPAQWDRSKIIPREHYLLVREHLTGPWRDALVILAGSGWHLTELIRFANSGAIEPLSNATRVEHGAAGVLLCPMHKSGDVHRTAVGTEVLEAGKRLLARGWPADSKFPFYQAIESACAAAGIPAFSPGRFRHSVASWAIAQGAAPESVAAFLGHKTMATTRRFYSVFATVPKVPTLA